MYRPKYLSLSEAVGVIAERLAYSSEQFSIEEARGQLIAALYDGAIRSEGVLREPPVEPDPSEPEPAIPPERRNISRPYWKNENYKKTMPLLSHDAKWMTITQTDRHGRITSDLDAVTVRWDVNCITWEEDDSGDYGYEDIHVIASDIDAAFPLPSGIALAGRRTPPAAPPDDAPLDWRGPHIRLAHRAVVPQFTLLRRRCVAGSRRDSRRLRCGGRQSTYPNGSERRTRRRRG
jgi:hypothetical protein